MWVGVSFDFNVKLLVGRIMKCATVSDIGDLQNRHFANKTEKELKEHKFLLVLDDC